MRDTNKKFVMEENSVTGRPKTYTHKWECFEKLRKYERIGTIEEFIKCKNNNFLQELKDILNDNSDICPECGNNIYPIIEDVDLKNNTMSMKRNGECGRCLNL